MNIKKMLAGTALAACLAAAPAQAQDFYLGQILLVGFTYCPDGTIEANGQILNAAPYQALYSLYGNQYGGTASSTFALPDMRGRRAVHVGQGPGLQPYAQAQKSGAEAVALGLAQLPTHTHTGRMVASSAAPNTDNPSGVALADFPSGTPIYTSGSLPPTVQMAGGTVVNDSAGQGQAFSLLDPYIVLRYCVVTNGLYPPRPD